MRFLNLRFFKKLLKTTTDVVCFAKVLTITHCNNASTFVPVFVAETILPRIDHEDPDEYQRLSMSDLQGNVWDIMIKYVSLACIPCYYCFHNLEWMELVCCAQCRCTYHRYTPISFGASAF
ncbi:hypothetical protein TSUD_205920 [Trifolium subterraneum]|uniref:Uncharacterized protein n=1 Tax=Trifolium subterraneum TaxID=3900 RepID=A0A2Z6MQR4_TRISU|nr:hypothetical protein TSUD_205920 [Trifolium subterraneum]